MYRASAACGLVICGVLAVFAVGESSPSDERSAWFLSVRRNYCSFFTCWTEAVPPPPPPINYKHLISKLHEEGVSVGEPMLKQENHGLSQAEELVRDENGLPYETHLHGRERSARQTSQTLADESQKLRGAYVGAVFNIPLGGAQQQLQQEEEGLVGEDDDGGDDEVDVPKEIEDDDRSSGLIFSAHHTGSGRHGKTALRETPAADTKSVASAAKEEVQRSWMVSQAVSADRTWEAQDGLTPSTQQLEEDEPGLAGSARAGEEQDEQDEIPLGFNARRESKQVDQLLQKEVKQKQTLRSRSHQDAVDHSSPSIAINDAVAQISRVADAVQNDGMNKAAAQAIENAASHATDAMSVSKETAEDALAAHAASNDGKIVAAVAREVDNKEKRGANLATSANVVRDAVAAAQEIDQEAQAAASAAKEEAQRSRMVSQAVSADRTWEAQEGLTPSTQQLEEDESGLAGGGRAGEEQDEQDEIPLDFTGAQTFAVDGEDGPHGDTEDVALPREAEDEQRSAGLIFNARRGNRASDQAGNVERKIKSQLQRVRQKIFEDRIKEREAARRVSNARFHAARTLSTDTPSQILDTHAHQMSSLHAEEVSSGTTSKGPSLPEASSEQKARATAESTAKAQATSMALGFRSAGALFRHLQHVEALKDKRQAVARYSSKLPGVALQGAQQTSL